MLKAVIFDMDGVIIDSEPMHARAAQLALQRFGVETTIDYAYGFIGSTTYHMCERMVMDFNLEPTVDELYRANDDMKQYLLQTEGHTVIPYIIDLIIDLHNNGLKLIIASSSPSAAIEEVMNSLNIRSYFTGYVSGMMVNNPKPAPDTFLKAAEQLGVLPNECLVIEDSKNGVNAAHAAGMPCIGYINPNSGKQDLSKATYLVEGFEEINYSFIHMVYNYYYKEAVRILETDRLIVQELTMEDFNDYYRICGEPSISAHIDDFSYDFDIERNKLKAYIDNAYPFYGYGLWGIYTKHNSLLVGCCGIELKEYNGINQYELSYFIEEKSQNNGYAIEAVKAILSFIFTKFDMSYIVALIDEHNTKSIKLANKLGMKADKQCIRGNRQMLIYKAYKDDFI